MDKADMCGAIPERYPYMSKKLSMDTWHGVSTDLFDSKHKSGEVRISIDNYVE
jgi:hypothetical protein